MNREPVNPDDPQMTAYALGELSVAEAVEFEARLQDSPQARRELAEMRVVMSLLGEGLRNEWQSESDRPLLRLLEPVSGSAGSAAVIVEGRFRPVRQRFAAAAAVAAMLLVGGIAAMNWKDRATGSAVGGDLAANSQVLLSPEAAHVPQLLLAEEVGDLSSLDFVDGDDLAGPMIDATYLEADSSIIPASFQPGVAGARGGAGDRVDSYLPPVGGISPAWGGATGMIERRLDRGGAKATRSESVLVSGYVTMDGGASAPRLLGSFRPVSISGNPVVNEESDLRLLADLNGLRKELSEVLEAMPDDAPGRSELERIFERSQRVVAQLKQEIAR